MAKNKSYWIDREHKALENYIRDDEVLARKCRGRLERARKNIDKEISYFYERYAKDTGITMTEARKKVAKFDVQDYSRRVKRIIKEKNLSESAKQELKLYNATMKINRLEMLKSEIGLELIDTFSDIENQQKKALIERGLDEYKRQAGILGSTVKNPKKEVELIVNGSFHNATFSDRIWSNMTQLKSTLDEILTQGMIQGKHPYELSRLLRKRIDVSKSNADRLLRTEMAVVQTESQLNNFRENGFGYAEIVAEADDFVCEDCEALDGEIVSLEDAVPGDNVPPFHPNCRCSLIPVFGSDDKFDFDLLE